MADLLCSARPYKNKRPEERGLDFIVVCAIIGGMKNLPPLLEFDNVSVVLKDRKVLDSLSLKIGVGENVAILGPNGSGKSTLIKTITRQYYPYPGKAPSVFKIFGEERWNIFDLRSLLGIVSDDLQQLCRQEISGEEIILSGFFSGIGLYKQKVTPEMKKKTREILDFLGITRLAGKYMNEMSSGEARRIMIARALVHDPKALLLDEPTNSLDLGALRKFQAMLGKIERSGKSIILVTHRLLDIIPRISRVILLKNGKLFMDGKKGAVLTSRNISALFDTPVRIREIKGYYYVG